ncbi:unnamed protein product [Rangifer tarandus platyrhynchus]|uniref:Uncharacterized protein n=2 Tax=Rangifer tarandus platyrhynchus TaxID=3082113 RepID=A0ABN8Y9Z3_RANTA|nr:unnamed protein product [Rangifer tarandus platyrhynchus]CAI9696092.1 unnamed protein product [Rangifer tarandus platyrhynchus]
MGPTPRAPAHPGQQKTAPPPAPRGQPAPPDRQQRRRSAGRCQLPWLQPRADSVRPGPSGGDMIYFGRNRAIEICEQKAEPWSCAEQQTVTDPPDPTSGHRTKERLDSPSPSQRPGFGRLLTGCRLDARPGTGGHPLDTECRGVDEDAGPQAAGDPVVDELSGDRLPLPS